MLTVLTCETKSSCVCLILTVYQSFCVNVSPIGRAVIVLYYCHVINDNVEFLIAIPKVVSKSNLELATRKLTPSQVTSIDTRVDIKR